MERRTKSIDTIKLYYISYRRGELCSPALICSDFDGRPQVAPTGCAMLYRVGRGLAPAVVLYEIKMFAKGEEAINIKFSASLPQSFFRRKTTALPSCGTRFCNAAWSAAQNRPLRQQMLPLSATGGGRICCPSEGACIGQPRALSLHCITGHYIFNGQHSIKSPEISDKSRGKLFIKLCYVSELRYMSECSLRQRLKRCRRSSYPPPMPAYRQALKAPPHNEV